MHVWSRALLVVSLLAIVGSSRAGDDATRAEAQALFDAGRELMDAGDHAAACPKLEAAQQLSPGMGILYNLAECYEAVGKLASAWSAFGRVATQADEAGYEDRAEDARARRDALTPKLTRLLIVVERPSDDLVVTRDGADVPRGSWGTPLPVDSGTYVLHAAATGKVAWTRSVPVQGEGTLVEVAIPELSAVAEPPPPKPPARRAPPREAPPATEDADGWQTPLGVAGMLVGGVTAVAGGAVAIAAKVIADGADCDADNRCGDEGLADRETAVAMGNAATGLLIAGGVLGAAGLVIWLTAPSEATVSVVVSPAGAGLRLGW